MLDWCQHKHKVLVLYSSYLNLNRLFCKYLAWVSLGVKKVSQLCLGHNRLSWAEERQWWFRFFGFSCLFLGFVVFSGFCGFWGALVVTLWQLEGKWLLHMAMLFLLSREKLQLCRRIQSDPPWWINGHFGKSMRASMQAELVQLGWTGSFRDSNIGTVSFPIEREGQNHLITKSNEGNCNFYHCPSWFAPEILCMFFTEYLITGHRHTKGLAG